MKQEKYLKSVELENIAQYRKIKIIFKDKLNIIFAGNGVGKTTFTRALKEYNFILGDALNSSDFYAWWMFSMSQSKNIFFQEESKTKLKFSDSSQLTLSFKNNKYRNSRGKQTDSIAICSDRESMILQSLNWTFGEITSLNMHHSHLNEYNDILEKYNEICKNVWVFISNKKRKPLGNLEKNPLQGVPYSAKNIFLKNHKSLLESISNINNLQLLQRIFLLTMIFVDRQNNKDEKLWKILSAFNSPITLKAYIESLIKSGINENALKTLRSLPLEKLFFVDTIVNKIQKIIPFNKRNRFIKSIANIKDLKNKIIETKQNIVKYKVRDEEMATFINTSLEYHPLKGKISINKDLSILSKNKKKAFALSTAEIKLLSLLIFVFQNKDKKTLIFDDPIVSMDYQNIYFVKNLLYELIDKSEKQLIILTHDLNLADILSSTHNFIKSNNISLKTNKKNEVVLEQKASFDYPLFQLKKELKNTNSEFLIPSLTRQILEHIATTFSRRGLIQEIIDIENNSFYFMGLHFKCSFKMDANFIHNLVHLSSPSSKNRWAIKKELFKMKNDVIKFVEWFLENAPSGKK